MSTHIEKPRYVCALGGAIATVNALPSAIPILHSSIGCGGNLVNAIGPAAGHSGSSYMGGLASPCSAVREREIVFGGDARLNEQIRVTLEITKAELYLVLTGCMVEMVGDDVDSVVREFKDEGVPILAVSTGGFKGNSLYGYDLVLQTLFRDYLRRDLPKKPGTVNLWGIPPAQDVFWEGNLVELRRVLELLGLTVNTFFTDRDDLESLRNAASAELNIVVSPLYGVGAAKVFEEEHGTPFLQTDFPIGSVATGRFLSRVAERLGIAAEMKDRVVAEEEKRYYRCFSRSMDAYNDIDLQRYAVIVGNANYAQALSSFVWDELGWLPELVVVNDLTSPETKDRIERAFVAAVPELAGKLAFETDTSRVVERAFQAWKPNAGERYYRSMSPAFVIGSSLDNELAEKLGAGHLAVTYPVSSRQVLSRATAGYRGALTLTEDLFSVILSAR